MIKKSTLMSIVLTLMVTLILIITGITQKEYETPKSIYQVYLDGEKIGLINNKDELYNMIDEEQKDIKEKYHVNKVYPPQGFKIVEYDTYESNTVSAAEVYDKIKDSDDFTIEGYIVTIKPGENNLTSDEGDDIEEEKAKETITLYVLDKQVFETAIRNYITSFITEEEFNNYINNTQQEIIDVGQIIENMYFDETITIKESYISVNEKIYTSATELSQYLLFGPDNKATSYTVKQGDTIAKIAEENKLNTKELLIANPKFKDGTAILAIGEKVNVSLINPVLTLIEDVYLVKDEEQAYEKETKYDSSKPNSYSEITQQGVTGIERMSQKLQIINGEENQGVDKVTTVTIREVVNEITTKGGKKPTSGGISGQYVDIGGTWGWPTNRPYKITSQYEYRWGSFHYAIDISGTGLGSPIYAAREGTIVVAHNWTGGRTGMNSFGNYIIIQHANNYYTLYAHLDSMNVSVGQSVSRGQIIGAMGNTGNSYGAHLHFSASVGMPYEGGKFFNPLQLYK